MTLPIDSSVLSKIHELVRNSVTRVGEVQRHLTLFVKNDIFTGKTVPPVTNRRFFPSRRDISIHVYLARQRLLRSKCDQKNVEAKVMEWKQLLPDDKFFFRPICCDDSTADEATKDIPKCLDGHGKKGLLFVHQTTNQRRLLNKYGNDICLLDATYRTTKYAMPFFQLCVKTNVDYQVVAVFVTQFEDSLTLFEPLQMLRDWNPEWKAQHFMVDFCESEINAVQKVFPGTFHHWLLIHCCFPCVF